MRTKFRDAQVEERATELVSVGALDVGDTIVLSHLECGDTRNRGYVTRKYNANGVLVDLFYCHNCNASDVRAHSGGSRWIASTALREVREEAEGALQLPNDVVSAAYTPTHINAWLRRYNVGDVALWSPSMGRIIMPVPNQEQGFEAGVFNYSGYQARSDPFGSHKVPKYLTVAPKDRPLRMVVGPLRLGDPPGPDPTYAPMIVWTEDWVSAHQFRRMKEVYGAPLFGVHVNPETILWADKLVANYTGKKPVHVVWLDNDVAKSMFAADYLRRLLQAMGRTAHVVACPTQEPKKVEESKLKEIIRDIRLLYDF